MKEISILLLFLLLTSCVANKPNTNIAIIEEPLSVEVAAIPKPVSTPEVTSVKITPRFFTSVRLYRRDYLYRTTSLKNKEYSLLIFLNKPSSELEVNRNIYICQSWLTMISTESKLDDIEEDDVRKDYIKFYTPLRKPIVTEDCKDILDSYDYERTRQIVNSLNLKINEAGIIYRNQKKTVKMDLTLVYNKSDITTAMLRWKEGLNNISNIDKEIRVLSFFDSIAKVTQVIGGLIISKL